MTKRKKQKMRKSILRRAKEIDQYRVEKAWRNIFIKAGMLK
ncbi:MULTISPECIES: DUF3983 domain-containing protein [Bacillus cereus group]|nr:MULTISPECIES: DUF3983 domain-containing protein [Bacillus cereus group]OPA04875.1 DUF3983 domain-containing protein [Bacillus cereus]PEL95300.1 DUF3983 domain-containing protein [Bacillus cereus]PGW49178.1 DUF3983 domain-containing protein [Bacillus thuringiensis]